MLLPELTMTVLRRIAGTGLLDTYVRLVYTPGAAGDYGYSNATYVAASGAPCLFKPRPTPDAMQESAVLMIDADLWVDRDATLTPHDRVRITHLHGDAVANPQTFEIVGGPVLGKTLLHAELRLVTDA